MWVVLSLSLSLSCDYEFEIRNLEVGSKIVSGALQSTVLFGIIS